MREIAHPFGVHHATVSRVAVVTAMRFINADDPIKGVGFVAINFAYLEDVLNKIIKSSGHLFTLPDEIDRWKFRDKAEWLQKQFRVAFVSYPYRHSDEDSVHVDEVLAVCREAAVRRNEILHRPIFGDMKGGVLRQAASEKMQPLDVEKIYRFAEHIDELYGPVRDLRFTLGRLLNARRAGLPDSGAPGPRRC